MMIPNVNFSLLGASYPSLNNKLSKAQPKYLTCITYTEGGLQPFKGSGKLILILFIIIIIIL